MSTIATVTPNLRPGYDRKMLELLSNRRESVPLIVVAVGDRTSKISRNKVDGHVQNFRAAITSRRQVLHGRNTNRVWSYPQSHVVAPPVVCDCVSSSRTISSLTSHKLSRLGVRPISMLPTISICNRSPRLVVRIGVRLLTILLILFIETPLLRKEQHCSNRVH